MDKLEAILSKIVTDDSLQHAIEGEASLNPFPVVRLCTLESVLTFRNMVTITYKNRDHWPTSE